MRQPKYKIGQTITTALPFRNPAIQDSEFIDVNGVIYGIALYLEANRGSTPRYKYDVLPERGSAHISLSESDVNETKEGE